MRPIRVRVENRKTRQVTEHEFPNSPVRIGRNPLNDLPLPYSFVSGWHAVIRFDDATARFFDLGSTNGTLIDGRRMGPGESASFDGAIRVEIGDLTLELSRRSGLALDPSDPLPPAELDAGERPWMQSAGTRDVRVGSIDTSRGAGGRGGGAHQTAHIPLGQIHRILATLRPAFEAANQARLNYDKALRDQLVQLPVHVREHAEDFIRREFGEVATRVPTRGATNSDAVARFSEELAPGLAPPLSEDEEQRFLRRVRDVLEACAKGLSELQAGQEQFGDEMGVRAVKEFTPLHTAASANNVLEYLLDWRHGGSQRIQELVGIFADSMIHQVALINGVVEGSRALLARLDPREIERHATSGWGRKISAKWDAYVARYEELASADRTLVEALFGPEFARAYAEVGGEQSPVSDGI